MKRCLIYFFYDRAGIADRYIINTLNDMKNCAERIVFVCNGMLSPESRDDLESVGVDIITRENKGYDIAAYKETLEYLGWDSVRGFDELVMMDCMYFPTPYSYSDMFSRMDGQTADIWSFTGVPEQPGELSDDIPEYSAAFFAAFRRSVLRSIEFRMFWDNVPEIKTYNDALAARRGFIGRFPDYGFRAGDFASLSMRGVNAAGLSLAQYIDASGMPAVQKRHFTCCGYRDTSLKAADQNPAELLKALENRAGYDADAIWENILRTRSLAELKSALGLIRVIPSAGNSADIKSSTGIMLFVDELESLNIYKESFKAFPDNSEINVFSPGKPGADLASLFGGKKCIFHETAHSPGDEGSMLDCLEACGCKYDQILSLRLVSGSSESAASAKRAIDALCASRDFVNGVIGEFGRSRRLGVLLPPANAGNDDNSAGVVPGMYWCRGEAMGKILAAHKETGRGLMISAQKAGYYPAWLYSTDSAAAEIANLLNELNLSKQN